MGFRVRKSIKICKGLKLNISKSGISTSIKVGNVTHNSKRGTTVNLGNGVSYKFDNAKGSKSKTIEKKETLEEKLDRANENIDSFNKKIEGVSNSMEQSKYFNWMLQDREKALKKIKMFKIYFMILGVICMILGLIVPVFFIVGIPCIIYSKWLDLDKLIEVQQKNFNRNN